MRIPSDDQFRMHLNSLGQRIAEDRRNGLQPMAVIATVGTTSTASVDPSAISAIFAAKQKSGSTSTPHTVGGSRWCRITNG